METVQQMHSGSVLMDLKLKTIFRFLNMMGATDFALVIFLLYSSLSASKVYFVVSNSDVTTDT